MFRVLLVCAFTLAVFLIASSLLGYSLFHQQILVADGWVVYDRFLKWPFWQSLWAGYTGHRLVFPVLFERANLAWFGGDLTNLVVLSLLLEALSGWLLTRIVASRLANRWSYWLLLCFVLSLLLWMGYTKVLTWAFGLTLILPAFGATLSFFSLWRCKITSAAGGVHWGWFACAIACALVATLSWGGAMVVWPILVIMALALRLPRICLSTLLLVGTAIIFVYFLPAPGDAGVRITFAHAPHAIMNAGLIALGMLGSVPGNMLEPYAHPYHAGAIWLARATGLLALALFGGFAVLWWRQKAKREYLLPIIGVSLFVLGAGLAAGFSRYDVADTWYMAWGLAPRFANLSGLLWAAVLCGLFALAAEWIRPGQYRYCTCVVTLLLLFALLPSQLYMFMYAGEKHQHTEKMALTLVNHVNDPKWPAIALYYKDSDFVSNLVKYFRQHHLTIFREQWTRWPGTRLIGHRALYASMQPVSGGLEKIVKKRWGWIIQGRTSRPHHGDLVVAVDEKGIIRGVAKFAQRPKRRDIPRTQSVSLWYGLLRDIDARLPYVLGWGRGWAGFVSKRYEPKQLRYYVVAKDKQVIGRLMPRSDR